MPEPLVRSIAGVTLAVRDLAAAESSYGAILGRTPSQRSATRLSYHLSNMTLVLMTERDNLPTWIKRDGEGIAGLTLRAAGTVRSTLDASTMRGLPISFTSRDEADAPAPLGDGVAEAEAAEGLHFLVMLTGDGDAVRQLFVEQLGFAVLLDRVSHKAATRQMHLRAGDTTLEVIQPLDPAKAARRGSFWGLAWDMCDIAAGRARLARAGVDVSEVRVGREPGTRVATVRGEPCGVPTLLVDRLLARGLG